MDEVIGAKRKAEAPVVERDPVPTDEETRSPWWTNKNETGWGPAKDVAANFGKYTERRINAEKVVERALNQAAGEKKMTIDMEGDLKDHMLLPADVVNRLLHDPANSWRVEPTQQQKDDEAVLELALDQADGEEMVTVDEKVPMKDHVLLPVDVVKRVFPGITNRRLLEKEKTEGK